MQHNVLLSFPLLLVPQAAGAQADSRPNVLFILCDDVTARLCLPHSHAPH